MAVFTLHIAGTCLTSVKSFPVQRTAWLV
ncbi:hypothetical protein MDA_GLEAN10000971 [Myotis davidii]|uniref:Uncharacterized protein n=1 Tax=Myotis davidii TaxID=225400 RepID=L5LFJ3_MYODS|nr:hypothetical protein MDA_GLEAN10000971 [Myotis davidii]